ncbi:MAG: hypothetical protein HQ593_02765 [Candidatus Omnitrophica bacterium]|nr:hypothetical protein [Candidatus Omnitrophota bacterium]
MLKDVKSEGWHKVPILGDIPILGALFKRKTYDTEKVDLLIFITANIIESDDMVARAVKMEDEFNERNEKVLKRGKKKKK